MVHKRGKSSREIWKKRYGRFQAEVTKNLRVRVGLILKGDKEKVRLKKQIIFRLKEVEEEIADKIIYVRSKERRKALMEIYAISKAIRSDIERSLAQKEVNLLQYGTDVLREKFNKLINYAVMAFHGLKREEDSLTKELARMYMTNLHPDEHHFTMNAIRLTDLTIQFLKGMKADFYVSYQISVDKLASPWSRVANILLQLAEFLSELMRRKGRREHVRNKSKGHYGTVKYDEPIHVVIDVNRVPVDELPLNTILGCSYEFMRFKAISLGRPELANRIETYGVYVIPIRKGKLTRHERLIKDPTLSYYYRFRTYRYFKPIE